MDSLIDVEVEALADFSGSGLLESDSDLLDDVEVESCFEILVDSLAERLDDSLAELDSELVVEPS